MRSVLCWLFGHQWKVAKWSPGEVTRTSHPQWLWLTCASCRCWLSRPLGYPGIEVYGSRGTPVAYLTMLELEQLPPSKVYERVMGDGDGARRS